MRRPLSSCMKVLSQSTRQIPINLLTTPLSSLMQRPASSVVDMVMNPKPLERSDCYRNEER